MRRIFATTLLALGLSGGAAMASPYVHHDGYRDARVEAFHRGFERGCGSYQRRDVRREQGRRDWRAERGRGNRW